LNLRELREEVIASLEAADDPYFTDDDVDEAINSGYDEISDFSQWYERRVPVQFLRGTVYYDMFAHAEPAIADLAEVANGGFLFVSSVWNTQTKRWLNPVSIEMLDNECNRRWEGNVGQPASFVMRGLRWLGVHPAPSASDGWLDVTITAEPPMLMEDRDAPGFPEEYHRGLVEYARCELYAQDREAKKALAAWDQYQQYAIALKGYADRRISASRVFIGGGHA